MTDTPTTDKKRARKGVSDRSLYKYLTIFIKDHNISETESIETLLDDIKGAIVADILS